MEETCYNNEAQSGKSSKPYDKNSDNQPLTLTCLSWEDILFTYILPLLSWKDLFHLRSTYSQNKLLVDAYFEQLKCIDLSVDGRQLSSPAFKVLAAECSNLRKIKIHSARWMVDGDLKPVFKNNELLSLLDLSECASLNGTCLLTLAVNCKRLNTLILRDCNWLSHGAVETLITHLSSLEVVDFSSCSAMSNQQLLPFVQKFYKLKELRVAYLQAVNDTTLLVIARNCGKSLQILDIRGCGNVTDRGVKMISEYCEILENIYVVTCNLVTEYSLRSLRERGVRIDRERAGELVPYVPFPVQT